MRALLLLFFVLVTLPVKAADPVLAPSGTLHAAYIGPNVAQARLYREPEQFPVSSRISRASSAAEPTCR